MNVLLTIKFVGKLETARFDVQRSDKNVFSIANVVKVDFSGSVKRIMFHFAKTSSDRDEWVEFGSPRIAPLHTKVAKKRVNSDANTSPVKETTKSSPTKIVKKKRPKSTDYNSAHGASDGKALDEDTPKKKQKFTRCAKPKAALDPSEKNNFVDGGTFSFCYLF